MLAVGGGDHGLAARAHEVDEAATPAGVELGHDVVEQHERRPAALIEQHVALREEEREEREALLAL